MKHNRALPGLTLLALCLTAGSARAQDAKLRQELQPFYDRSAAYARARDFKGLMSQYVAGYRGETGETDGTRELFAQLKSVSTAKMTVERAIPKGKGAVARVRITFDAVLSDAEGALGPKGKTHRMAVKSLHEDTLVKTAGGWKIRRSIELPGKKFFIDGKVVPEGQ